MFGKVDSPLCSFCKMHEETISHLFFECLQTKMLWEFLNNFFNNTIILPNLTLQTAILGFDGNVHDKVLVNHILLIFKLYIYNSREKGQISTNNLIANITKIKKTEKELATISLKCIDFYNKKWEKTNRVLPV